jgi:hypothetical protein
MAGSSFGKYERDRNKRAKAAAKRDRRQNKSSEDTDVIEEERGPMADLSPEELLRRIEDIHRRFDEGTMSYDDFEEQKQALLSSLPVD